MLSAYRMKHHHTVGHPEPRHLRLKMSHGGNPMLALSLLVTGSSLLLLSTITTGFVIPGMSPSVQPAGSQHHQESAKSKVVLRKIVSRPGQRFAGWSRPPSLSLFSSSTDDTAGDSHGRPALDAVEQEMDKIKTDRMTAGQIKKELDTLGVSYTGLLEKIEYVRALAEARVSPPPPAPDAVAGSGATTTTTAAGPDDSVTPTDDPSSSAPTDDSESKLEPELELEPEPEPEPETSPPSVPDGTTTDDTIGGGVDEGVNSKAEPGSDTTGDGPAAVDPREEQEKSENSDAITATATDTSAGGTPAVGRASQEDDSSSSIRSSSNSGGTDNTSGTSTMGDEASVDIQNEEPPVSTVHTGTAGAETADAASAKPSSDGEASTTSDDDAVAREVAKIREDRMTAKQIVAELGALGVGHVGLLEKPEFVERLAEARVDPGKFRAGDGAGETAEETAEEETGEGESGSGRTERETATGGEEPGSPATAAATSTTTSNDEPGAAARGETPSTRAATAEDGNQEGGVESATAATDGVGSIRDEVNTDPL